MTDQNIAGIESDHSLGAQVQSKPAHNVDLEIVQGPLSNVQRLMKEHDLPPNCLPNRLGDQVYSGPAGEVYETTREDGVHFYFYWPADEGRGHRAGHKEGALQKLGVVKPVGCDDYEGQVRLGKKVESQPLGDIWKYQETYQVMLGTSMYFVWPADGTWATKFGSLAEARIAAGYLGTPPEKKTQGGLHAAKAKKAARSERDRQEYAKKASGSTKSAK